MSVNDWDTSKENMQPLKRGRAPEALALATKVASSPADDQLEAQKK